MHSSKLWQVQTGLPATYASALVLRVTTSQNSERLDLAAKERSSVDAAVERALTHSCLIPKSLVDWDLMPTMPWEEFRKPMRLRKPEYQGEAIAKAHREKLARVPPPPAPAADSQPAETRAAQSTVLADSKPPVESEPLSTIDSNPVLDSQGAAFVLGVSVDLLKKWRQRHQGPDYIKYGTNGPVRYEIKTLLHFRDQYRMYLNSQR
jgi:hypothetical protein